MSRIVDHECRSATCSGKQSKWFGTALFCMSCDAWQRDKAKKAKSPQKEEEVLQMENIMLEMFQVVRWSSYAKKAGICLDHGNALPCDEC